ncbi:MAG: class I SAM-dependent methyltransferase [Rhodospirillaceae bacterium]
MNPQSIVVSLLSLLPPGRRFVRAFRDMQAGVTDLRIQVGGLKAALNDLQHAEKKTRPKRPTVPKSIALGPDPDRFTARELQLLTAAHQPLLAGDLKITDIMIEVTGIAIAPDCLFDSMSFHFNGVIFDEVVYPMEDAGVAALFSEIKGAAAFVARIARSKVDALAPFFRIDVSPTGTFVTARWRQAIWFGNPALERFPMPPANAMRRVIGDDHAARFSMGGATMFKKIEAYIGEMGKTWSDFSSILDWGSGAGRLTRYLLAGSGRQVTGADIDADNIKWCQKNLKNGRFVTLELAPPTPFTDGEFNLVVGCSVVTHLTEEMLFAWLQELRRVTAPGAILFLSVAGPVQFSYLGIPAALYRRMENEGFIDFARDGALDGHISDDTYYRSTWMSRGYITRTWTRYFDVLAILDGVASLQDFVVLRRRAD